MYSPLLEVCRRGRGGRNRYRSESPLESHDVISPTRGLMICSATNPFVTAGTPVGHILPVTKGAQTIRKRLDEDDCLVISGADGDPFGEMMMR